MSTLVTGAAGFIGSHLTEALLWEGETVIGIDNFDGLYDRSVKERDLGLARDHDAFRLVEGDIRDSEALSRLPDSVDSIIHLAALAGVRPSIADPVRYTDLNLMGTSQVLAFAKECGIKSFLFASSSSVYGNNRKVPFSGADPVHHAISPDASRKKSGELLCHAASHLDGIGMICLRFFTVYGPRQRPDLAILKFARLMRAGEEIPKFGDGSTSRDYTYITDILDGVTKAHAWSRANPGDFEVAYLGESRTITLTEMIDTISDVLGVEPKIRQVPMRPQDEDRTFADVSKAREILGYDPVVGFREGLEKFAKWLPSTSQIGRTSRQPIPIGGAAWHELLQRHCPGSRDSEGWEPVGPPPAATRGDVVGVPSGRGHLRPTMWPLNCSDLNIPTFRISSDFPRPPPSSRISGRKKLTWGALLRSSHSPSFSEVFL